MAFTQVENAFLSAAIAQLRPQWVANYGPINGPFYLGRDDLRFMTLNKGPDNGKLTMALSIDGMFVQEDGNLVPDPNITPVDCYNLMNRGECLADAVKRVFGTGNYTRQSIQLTY